MYATTVIFSKRRLRDVTTESSTFTFTIPYWIHLFMKHPVFSSKFNYLLVRKQLVTYSKRLQITFHYPSSTCVTLTFTAYSKLGEQLFENTKKPQLLTKIFQIANELCSCLENNNKKSLDIFYSVPPLWIYFLFLNLVLTSTCTECKQKTCLIYLL